MMYLGIMVLQQVTSHGSRVSGGSQVIPGSKWVYSHLAPNVPRIGSRSIITPTINHTINHKHTPITPLRIKCLLMMDKWINLLFILFAGPPELRQFRRILRAQLLYGLQDHHLWLSLWERPAHSAFSRAQRVTCCALILHLYLAAGAVWYGSVATSSSG